MLENYLKIAIRNIWRRKFYAAANIGGLAIGLAVCLAIVFYVKHEFSYDRHHDKSDRIVRITTKFETPDKPMLIANTPVLLASYLNKDYPEIEKTARLQITEATVKHHQQLQKEQNVYFSEQSVFDIFSFPFLEGNATNALAKPDKTFALFTQNPDLKSFDKKLQALSRRYVQPELKAQGADGYKLIFQTEPLKDVHSDEIV